MAVIEAKLAKHAGDVRLDSLGAETEPDGDLAVRPAPAQLLEHFLLGGGQDARVRGSGCPGAAGIHGLLSPWNHASSQPTELHHPSHAPPCPLAGPKHEDGSGQLREPVRTGSNIRDRMQYKKQLNLCSGTRVPAQDRTTSIWAMWSSRWRQRSIAKPNPSETRDSRSAAGRLARVASTNSEARTA